MSEQEVFDALKYRVEVDAYGTRRYFNKADQLHRDDGPAVEYTDGSKYWYQNGLRHRTDGPAIEYNNGGKFWYQNDKLHRTDGPAIIWINGVKEWWIGGKQLTEDEYNLAVKQYV